MSNIIKNSINRTEHVQQQSTLNTSGRFAHYHVNDITKQSHPRWAAVVEKIYAIINFFIQGLNYLHARIWTKPVTKVHAEAELGATTAPCLMMRDQGTSLPLQEPNENSGIAIQDNLMSPAALTGAEDVADVTQLEESSSLTEEEMLLFKEYHVAEAVCSYVEQMQKNEKKTPTDEEIQTIFSKEIITKIHEAVEESVKALTPQQLREVKQKIKQAQASPEYSQYQQALAMGCGAITGVAIMMLSVFLGNYLSDVGLGLITQIKSYTENPLSGFFGSVLKLPFSLAVRVAQVLAVGRRVLSWTQIGSGLLSAVEGIQKIDSLKHTPKACFVGLSGTVVAVGGYTIYKGVNNYIQDHNYAISNEGSAFMRSKISKYINIGKDQTLELLLPKKTKAQSRASFDRGYAAGSVSSLTYITATALGLSTPVALPLAAAAGAGAYYINS